MFSDNFSWVLNDSNSGIYNSLILYVEDKISRTKKSKRKRLLNGMYLEIFVDFNKNSKIRSIYETLESNQRQEQFLGFFMEELDRVGLKYLSDSLDRRNPDITRVELRADINDKLYRYITWGKISQVKSLEHITKETELSQHSDKLNQDELDYIRSLAENGNVSYLELTIGSEIYGGKDPESFRKLSSHSLFVREDLSLLPKRYGKNGSESQIKILSTCGRAHNMKAMIYQYLSDAGIKNENLSGKERRKLFQEVKQLKYDRDFTSKVSNYYRLNRETPILLPDTLKNFSDSSNRISCNK